jgi:hypothetical protein
MSFEIEGLVHKIFEIEKKTDTFQTREFVIQTEENYPQFVKFQMTQDRCNIIDGYAENDKVKVFFDLRGREWNGKYFTNLNAWRVQKVENVAPDGPADNMPPVGDPMDFPTQEPKGGYEQEVDDLPF